jgi:hypothetical protein
VVPVSLLAKKRSGCQHARAMAVFTAPHEDRAAAHLCGALNSLQRYKRSMHSPLRS